jgi:Na+/serine symporter
MWWVEVDDEVVELMDVIAVVCCCVSSPVEGWPLWLFSLSFLPLVW